MTQLAIRLKQDGADVHIVSMFSSAHSDLEDMLAQASIPVIYLGKRAGRDLRVYRWIDRIVANLKPDIIHTHLHILHYVIPAIVIRRVPVTIHTIHNPADQEAPWLARVLNFGLFRIGLTPIAIAEDVKASIQREYRLKDIRLIPNGISVSTYIRPQVPRDAWRIRQGLKHRDILFVCVAALRRQKNHTLLIQAFARGPARDPRSHLLIVGDGALRRELDDVVNALGLVGRVHFLGVRSDISDILSAADVFVLSSHYEGNPLSVMEAMAAGLPVISTAVGGVPELIEDMQSGLLIKAGDVEGFSRAMVTLMSDENLRVAMGQYAQQQAIQRFDVRKMVDAYESLYHTLLSAKMQHHDRGPILPLGGF